MEGAFSFLPKEAVEWGYEHDLLPESCAYQGESPMSEVAPAPKRLDAYTLQMIVVLALISLHDFLLSDLVSLPLTLRRSPLAIVRSLEHVASSLEFLVPVILFTAMLVLWPTSRTAWERRVAIVYLAWVTLRLVIKIGLVLNTIILRPQSVAGVLLRDTIILWIVNFVIFGAWYWIIDGDGPRARCDGAVRRSDFIFPQHAMSPAGWGDWQPGFWDYLFLGFSGNTQFGLGDTSVLSLRAKFLLMIQVTLSIGIIVFIASFAISLTR
jgi:hypothetical protein